jgi:hypothetical protein
MRSINLAFEVALVVMAAGIAAGQGTATAPPPGFAGSELCGTCHEDIANAFGQNPHHAVEPIQAASSARTGWHGTISTASHALANTTTLGESCTTCHNSQSAFSVGQVHAMY